MALSASKLSVGATHGIVVVDNLTRTQIVQYAGASGDYNPLHTDEVFATQVAGYPSVFAHGMLTMGMTGRMLTDYVGDGRLLSFGGRFTSQVWPGDTLTAAATVTAIDENNGVTVVSLDVATKNQEGVVVFPKLHLQLSDPLVPAVKQRHRLVTHPLGPGAVGADPHRDDCQLDQDPHQRFGLHNEPGIGEQPGSRKLGPGTGNPFLHQVLAGIAALYFACTALRLARFNVENDPDPEFDLLYQQGELGVVVDIKSAKFLKDTTLDYNIRNLMEGGFVFENPQAVRSCGCGTSFTAK